jgi:pyruvate dehydrogenase E2 component (dihydrolipoamide acetyltransferase)
MANAFKLPDLGEGIHEGEVLAVLVSVGDEVKEGDPILEVETDKAAVEIPSPYTGKVSEILVKPGDTVKVGDVLMTFNGDGEAEAVQEEVPEKKAKAPKPEDAVSPAPTVAKDKGPVPASPATRRLARELGVDLHHVTASGPGGLVTAEDVRTYAESGDKEEEVAPVSGDQVAPVSGDQVAPVSGDQVATVEPETPLIGTAVPPLPDFSKWGSVEKVPVRSVRKATAKQMSLAWSQIPHVHNEDWVDITKLESFRRKHKAEIEAKGGKLTLTVFALKAAATALKTYPNFNASLDTRAGEIVIKHYFHLGVAVNTENGLIVPVIRDVDRKSITELAIELTDLVNRTRERKATLEEMQGGTFTITNVGPMGGGFFAPIINYPQVSIMGMGSARLQPVVRKGGDNGHEIVPRLMMPIVLCIDHRVLDGAYAIQFLRVVIDALEDPDELLMTMI